MNDCEQVIHNAFNALGLGGLIESFAMSLFRTLIVSLTAASLAIPAVAAPRAAQSENRRAEQSENRRVTSDRQRDQDRAFRATREGRSMPLPMIKQRVMPLMGGADYIGSELKGDATRLKFMQDGRVIWVDVDAATGRIVRRSGN